MSAFPEAVQRSTEVSYNGFSAHIRRLERFLDEAFTSAICNMSVFIVLKGMSIRLRVLRPVSCSNIIAFRTKHLTRRGLCAIGLMLALGRDN